MMERLRVLDDARKLKQLAEAFLYPERPVVTASETAYARNYFHRASAPEVEVQQDCDLILKDAAAFKKLAVDYAHPELPVVTTDATTCGRNYFDRASAPEKESLEEVEDHEHILEDSMDLKKFAAEYAHPESGVVTTDETTYSRNYFGRASAPELTSTEEAAECARIIDDMEALKKLAVEYLHPKRSVITTDETACARNYFDRASAIEREDDAAERDLIMADMMHLKKFAIDFAHPELGVVTTDETAYGRSYFGRASAPEQMCTEKAEEYDRFLADAMDLKKFAAEYAHPESGVVTTDETTYSRNYFGRASAPELTSTEEAAECARIIDDMEALKKLAVEYLHPERSVITTDETACARNYFDRASAIEREDDAAERDLIMADMMHLKKFAIDFAHPELGVVTTDETAYGRSYFGRASAPEQMCTEKAEEYDRFLADAMDLKKLAVEYAHPELGLVTTDPAACGRNYFVRASARGHNFISTTREESIKFIDEEVEEDHYLDECDFHYGNFAIDEEMVTDMKYQIHSLLDHSHSSFRSVEEVQAPMDKEEAGKLSRSPSSVMLFGGYEETTY